jgi:2,4-dienoyl-CoA reductase-like NADH-dependent reductase (Old Yellow Enzyme family)/thioredoxin reductase
MEDQFKNLFSPIQIGSVTLRNRIVMPAHVGRFHPTSDAPNERALNYFEARAKGGVGLIITAPNMIRWLTTAPLHASLESDSCITDYKRLADAVHKHGAKIFGQLSHFGSYANARFFGGGSTFAPSAIARVSPFNPLPRGIPMEMDTDDIQRFVEAFASAAGRLKKAGYDGVEIAAMYGMLVNSFLSPIFNRRTDQYGGNMENRMRFLLEIIAAIREREGSDFVVGVRFTGDEFADGGYTIDHAKEIAKKLEATGQVNYLFACAGLTGTQHVPSMYYPLAPFVYIAAAIKEAVELPVMVVGRINDSVLAENILANHQADMIAMLRALIADPELPKKVREGRLDEIRKCIACNEGCTFVPWRYIVPLTCAMNPEAGREKEFAIMPAKTKKTVMIIGGGVAGLETARVAALRGHRVSLYEKEDVLAKDLAIASKAPGRKGWEDAQRYYIYQMRLLDVDLHLGVEVTPDMVLKQNYDAVVVATGTLRDIPEIAGSDSDQVFEMKEVLEEKVVVGKTVVVVAIQHHMHGLQMADFLSEKGNKVQLVTTSAHAGEELDSQTVEDVHTRLLTKGVTISPLTGVKAIRDNVVITYNVLTGVESLIEPVDTVVFCTGGKANDVLYRSLKGKVKELYKVGQCVSPRELLDSVYDGAQVGRML